MVKTPRARHGGTTHMIENKRIWITGASSGIGSELALQLADAGNKVVVSARGLEKLQSIVLKASGLSGSITALAYDVTKDDQTESITAQLKSMLGGLDILIICAGRCEYIDNAQLETDLFRRVYEVNVFGAVNATRAAMPLLQASASNISPSRADKGQSDKPQIVPVASLSAVTGLPRAEAYGSSKAAMIYLFNTLRLDLQKRIDVTIVNPGFVETEMTKQNDFPMPFLMQPADAATRIIKGIERRKLTVNFPLRLWLSLKLPSLVPWLWYRWLGPRLVRTSST